MSTLQLRLILWACMAVAVGVAAALAGRAAYDWVARRERAPLLAEIEQRRVNDATASEIARLRATEAATAAENRERDHRTAIAAARAREEQALADLGATRGDYQRRLQHALARACPANRLPRANLPEAPADGSAPAGAGGVLAGEPDRRDRVVERLMLLADRMEQESSEFRRCAADRER